MVEYVGEYVGNMLVNMLCPLVNEQFVLKNDNLK
jgi:hypothetical protein